VADDWEAARGGIFPVLLAPGTQGEAAERPHDWATEGIQAHAQPLVTEGPCGLVVGFTLEGSGFDVLVNAEHLHGWGIDALELATTAGQNLAAWSSKAPWSDEISGTRRLVSSETGEGHDAARIILPEVKVQLLGRLAADAPAGTRVLVGLPDRDLLVAGALLPDDPEFAALLHDFVIEHSAAADQPIDRRLFELSGGELVEFAG
jgi:hypothetical protein